MKMQSSIPVHKFPALVPTGQLAAYLTPITDFTKPVELPYRKAGVIVFHRASSSYYSTKVNDPFAYYKRLKPGHPSHTSLALALQRAIGRHPEIDVFYTNEATRVDAENILKKMGYRRVATGRGERIARPHNLFSVTAKKSNIVRYVCADAKTPEEEIIASAEEGIRNFLTSQKTTQVTLRQRMLPIAGWTLFSQPKVFDHTSTVTDCGVLTIKPKDYSAFVREKNLQALFNRAGLSAGSGLK